MQHKEQNAQIELLTKMALTGGGYSWNSVPISDSNAEDPNFYISQPQEPLRKAMLSAARRRDNELLTEPHVETGEYSGAGPRNPYRVPAAIVPHEEGEGLSLTRPEYALGSETRSGPGPRPFRESFGSGEGQKLLAQLDALSRKMLRKKKRSRDERAPHGASRVAGYIGTSGVMREAEDQPERGSEEWKRERDRQESSHVSNDRSAAMDDISLILPLPDETLAHWHPWLYKKIESQSLHRANLDRLKVFLRRVHGGRKFSDLHWKEKEELASLIRDMVATEEAHEAHGGKAA